MEFGDILSKSWGDYKINFREFFKLFLLFYALPGFIVTLLWIYTSYTHGLYDVANMINFTPGFSFFKDMGVLIFVGLLAMFIYQIFSVSLITGYLKKDKFSYNEALESGKKVYWKSIGFVIVLAIFLILLFIALVIPGIIFMTFWVFGYFVFLNEGKGIIESLKRSFYLVKGRWWMTFGYILLLMIILSVISFVFSIPAMTMGLVSGVSVLTGNSTSPGFFVSLSFVDFIFSMLASLITIPLAVFFFRNMYFEYRKRK